MALPGWCGQILLPSRCHKDQGLIAAPGIRPLTCNFLVAGQDEPAASGL